MRSAFNRLVLTKGYAAFSAADVAGQANVGRSTFYEHYRGKEDILAQSLLPILAPLADTCVADRTDPALLAAVEHFWTNRRHTRALLTGRARDVVVRQLALLIGERLARTAPMRSLLPAPIAAAHLANGQIAIIDAWVTGQHGSTATAIADALHRISRAVTHALDG